MNSTCQITNIYRDMKSPTASKLEELECQTNNEDLEWLTGAPSSRPFPSRGNARGGNHHNGNELVPMVSGDSSTGSKGKEKGFLLSHKFGQSFALSDKELGLSI